MKHLLILALTVPLIAAPVARADELAAGHWKITTLSPNGASATSNWLLKLETTGGKTSATLASANPAYKQTSLKSFAIKGDTVSAVVVVNGFEQIFEGKISKDGKKVLGTFGTEDFPNPAWMAPTDATELDKKSITEPAGEAGAGLAALFKLRNAKKGATPDADLVEWADTAGKDAAQYGPAWEFQAHLDIATLLLKHPGLGGVAMQHAQRSQKLLSPTAPLAQRIRALEAVVMAAHATGKGDQVKGLVAEVAKLDAVLDKEYIAQGLPFKPGVFEGRKSGSKRAVVLELFTGAQCPPCVAADLAFDGLMKTYKPSELVLIQYHVHIPGPDPLTNSETEARWKHYIGAFGKFGKKLGGVPTAIVNGNADRVGGGPLAFAEKTYDAYRGMIDPLLETPAACQLKLTVKRAGDQLDMQADVSGVEKPGTDLKLRFAVVEEVVHYGGGNKIRMHHHVVRAMPGGVEGKAIMEKEAHVKAAFDVASTRGTLTKYLDDFVSAKGLFPRAIRPMDMHELKVIAFVQDDESREILQAVQVDVGER